MTPCNYYGQPASYGATDIPHHHERQANNRDRSGSNHDRRNNQQGNSPDELSLCNHDGPPASYEANTTHNHITQANNGIKSGIYSYNMTNLAN